MTSVDELVVSGLDGLTVDLVGPTSVVADASNGLGDIDSCCPREGLAVVKGLKSSKLVEVLLHKVGKLVQEGRTLETRGLETPYGLESFVCGLNGEVDILGGTLSNRGDNLASGRVDHATVKY